MATGPDAAEPSSSSSEVPQLQLQSTCTGHTQAVSAVRFSPSGDLLASASADKSLRLWRVADGSAADPNSTAMERAGGINDVAWNPQGNYLATASDDLTARIWDVESGKCLVTLAGHTNYVFCCRFNPVGHILVRCQACSSMDMVKASHSSTEGLFAAYGCSCQCCDAVAFCKEHLPA
jgi:COMPASS component SWD3